MFLNMKACEGERMSLPSGEEVEVEFNGKVYLKMHNCVVRLFGIVKYLSKMMRNLI